MTAPTTGTPLPDAHGDPSAGYLATHRERAVGEPFARLRTPSVSIDRAGFMADAGATATPGELHHDLRAILASATALQALASPPQTR